MIVVIGLPAYVDEADGEICAGGLAVEIAAEARRRGAQVELAGKVGGDGAGDAVVVALGRLGVGHAALLRDAARPTPLLVAEEGDATMGAGATATAAPAATAASASVATGDAIAAADPDGRPPLPRLLPEDPNGRPALEAGDVEMALRYLTGPRVVVVAEPLSAPALSAAAEGAAFSGASLVILTAAGAGSHAGAPVVPDLATATVLEMPPDDDGSFARLVGAYAASLDAGTEPGKAFRDGVAAVGWERSPD